MLLTIVSGPSTSLRPCLSLTRSSHGILRKRLCKIINGSGQSCREEMGKRKRDFLVICRAQKDKMKSLTFDLREGQQIALWGMEGIYVIWLFLLPFAPGDPIWDIKPSTISDLLNLSLNFFFILPLANSVGFHVIEAPVLHPVSEGLFNLVIGWTFMFAPLLFSDCKRDRYKGSLEILWGLQMFLTNVFLIPYMAIRLNRIDSNDSPRKHSKFGFLVTNGAPIMGLIGVAVCLGSIWWAVYGRGTGEFGTLMDRWTYFISYIGSERLAYAFIWDIALYTIFQPWLIGDNLQNLQEDKVGLVRSLRFLPIVGLIAYLLSLDSEKN